MPEARRVFRRSSWRFDWSSAWLAARTASSADSSESRIAVSSSFTSKSPRLTGSPFSFSTCSTTAETSARKSARRSGWIEPVITGPEASASLRTVSRSSGATNSWLGLLSLAWAVAFGPALAGSLPSLPQAARADAMARTSRVLRSMLSLSNWTLMTCIF